VFLEQGRKGRVVRSRKDLRGGLDDHRWGRTDNKRGLRNIKSTHRDWEEGRSARRKESILTYGKGGGRNPLNPVGKERGEITDSSYLEKSF